MSKYGRPEKKEPFTVARIAVVAGRVLAFGTDEMLSLVGPVGRCPRAGIYF